MAIILDYTTPPSFAGIYKKLLLKKSKPVKPGDSLPEIEATWPGAKADPAKVKAYCEACGFNEDGNLPITYPHVLTGHIHLGIMAHDKFPLSPMGALHMRNHIVQHAPIPVGATMDVVVRVAGSRVVKAGLEFDFTTEITIDGAVPWESISTYMVRGKKFGEPGEAPAIAAMPPVDSVELEKKWPVPKNMGRRYAKISGDYNPIHISKILAKFFGFKRDLVHGMWVLGKTVSSLPAPDASPAQRLDVSFKGPVFMTHTVTLQAQAKDGGHAYQIFVSGNDRPCIQGAYRTVGSERLLG
jgi:acyl dehydratase